MSDNQVPKDKTVLYFVVGSVLALLIWGLQLIGVTVNIWLGGLVLLIAFALMVYAFWTWEGASRWHTALRVGTVAIAALLYFGLVGWQVVNQWRREHPLVRATLPVDLSKAPIASLPSNIAAPRATSKSHNHPGKLQTKEAASTQRQESNTGVRQQSSGNNSPNVSAPYGIAIGGGNVTSPTVTNNIGLQPLVINETAMAALRHSLPTLAGKKVKVHSIASPTSIAARAQLLRVMADAGVVAIDGGSAMTIVSMCGAIPPGLSISTSDTRADDAIKLASILIDSGLPVYRAICRPTPAPGDDLTLYVKSAGD